MQNSYTTCDLYAILSIQYMGCKHAYIQLMHACTEKTQPAVRGHAQT